MTEEQNKSANEAQTENIVGKILSSNVKWFIGLAMFIAGVVAPYYQIKSDIALITNNHFAHMETMTREIERNSVEIKEMKILETELLKAISENSYRLKTLENK